METLRRSVDELEVGHKDHERRINALEKTDTQLIARHDSAEQRLSQMEQTLIKVENTVISESQKMREGYEKTTERVFALVEQQGTYKEASATRNHAESTQKLEYKRVRFERIAELLTKFGVAGGIIYVIIDNLIASFMK